MYRLAVLNSHPIQYFAPMYRRLALEKQIDLKVYYCSKQGMQEYTDPGFGEKISWDSNLIDGYQHMFLKNMRQSENVGGFWSLINLGIITELLQGEFDAIWVHGHSYATYLIAIFVARLLGIHVFMRSETHLLLKRSPTKRLLRRFVLKILYSQCSAFLAIGTRNADFYSYYGVPQKKIELVPYTVDNKYFTNAVEECWEDRNEIRSELGLRNNIPVILYASKMTYRKNPMHLLQAFDGLRKLKIDAELVFLGSGNESEYLMKYVAHHKLKNVHFLGFKNQSELPKYFAAADIFVLPSENEPWGLIINEAMCAKLPIIASSEIGAVADLVKDNKNGLIFESGDIDALTACLEKLCLDGNLRTQMSGASLQIIQDWSNEKVVEGVLAALSKVVQ